MQHTQGGFAPLGMLLPFYTSHLNFKFEMVTSGATSPNAEASKKLMLGTQNHSWVSLEVN